MVSPRLFSVWLRITRIKDVTHFTPLFAKTGDLMMDFSNIIAPDLYAIIEPRIDQDF